jgi:hypothetical protein
MTKRELPALRAQLAAERRRLREAVAQVRSVRAAVGDRHPTAVELMACAGFLHSVYNGIENCLSRVAHAVDESVPRGSESHRLLLDQLSVPLEGIRPAVIGQALLPRLDEFRRFRNAFRLMYSFELEWDRVRPLADSSTEIVEAVEHALDTLLDALSAS